MDDKPVRHEGVHGVVYVTRLGEIVRRPRRLPQDHWLVSDQNDGLYYRVYVRAGWLRRLLTGRRWRCVSGERLFRQASDAWSWVEESCVNRLRPNDWHGVGYARWMQAQLEPPLVFKGHSLPPLAWMSCYTTEPPWVNDLYRDGPPLWERDAV